MINLTTLSIIELKKYYEIYMKQFDEICNKNLKLDMSRGKPSPEQLDLSSELLSLDLGDITKNSNIDYRNYGIIDGISEIKNFISECTGIPENLFFVGGNSSLSMMFDTISCFMIHGVNNCVPWAKQENIRFLCPVPGYDRHFAMCEHFGIDMIPVKMNSDGPDMNFIENMVSSDNSIKGIWCVPKFSNPTGVTYSNEVIARFAKLKPAAQDFRIFWDNAYFFHDFSDNFIEILDIITECKKYNNQDLPIVFFSTSKITFAGSGVAFMACEEPNLSQLKKNYSFKTISFDKINQLRHIVFLKNKENLKKHMLKHAEIIKSKFNIVIQILNKHFGKHNEILTWSEPNGGYFINITTQKNCAKKIVSMCKQAGVIFTDAGATFPYKNNPDDNNIRIAPTYPDIGELKNAIEIFCLVTKIVYIKNKLDIDV